MNEITPEHAAQIHDIESYKAVTGEKRFRRTKEEISLGLSPEEALQSRLRGGPQNFQNDGTSPKANIRETKTTKGPRPSTSRKSDIIIRIRPAAGTDADYFEDLPDTEIEIVEDEKFYSWLDVRLKAPYDGDVQRLLRDILDLGIGEVITKKHFPEDLE